MDVGNADGWGFLTDNVTPNSTTSTLYLDFQNTTSEMGLWSDANDDITHLEDLLYSQEKAYRDFATAVQVFILVGSLLGNVAVLWCTHRTTVFRSVTGRFLKNLACSSICAGLVCVPFDVLLSASPRCCLWMHTPLLCKTLKFLHRLFCSVTMLSFAAIAVDRYYSVLYPLERKLSDAKSRDVLVYIWGHAVVASIPVFAVTNVMDVYATSSCSEGQSLGHLVYMVVYNITTVILPLATVFLVMGLIRRALSASQKKKVIIAALRTPQNSISIPYVSQREAELHATLLSVVLAFSLCSAPYTALVVYHMWPGAAEASPWLRLTAVWLPKVSLLTNPLLFVTVNRSARHSLLDLLGRLQQRCSRRNAVGAAGLVETGTLAAEMAASSGSQLLEMFNIGQQQIFRPNEEEEEEEEEENQISSVASATFARKQEEGGGGGRAVGAGVVGGVQQLTSEGGKGSGLPPLKHSPTQACTCSSSQVAPATPTDAEDATQFGFGPFELPPQWLPETRNSKKRLLPPLGNTPEELIQTKQPKGRPERRISRNNKVSTFPAVDP